MVRNKPSAFRLKPLKQGVVRPRDVEGIVATFTRRKTPLPEALPLALTSDFTQNDSKQKQWKAFGTRAGVTDQTFEAIVCR